ncbi:hypothetical protein M9Y10_037729 [Tritrichomonas musculus]|uniref:Peptidase S8/S53 domain-containing protein n=1 Tax=Tritrichomonas musculus TaxID=1915356 RepID=A0ABR2GRC1_9EUKA
MMNSHASHISSNSCGDYDIYVDSLNNEYGSLAARDPQSLFVFSAGNHGQGGIGNTVSDPSGSKNVLTVAYSESPIFSGNNQYTLHTPDHPDFVLSLYYEHMKNLYATVKHHCC